MEKFFEKLPYNTLSKVKFIQMVIGAAIVGAAIFGGYWFTLHADLEAEYAAVEKKKVESEKKIQQYNAEIVKIPGLTRRVATLAADLDERKRQLPTEEELPGLLNRVSQLGQMVGVNVKSFKFQLSSNPEDSGTFYRKIPISIEVVGNYYSTVGFFDSLRNLLQVVNVEDLVMKKKSERVVVIDDETGKPGYESVDRVATTIKAVTFAYIEGA